MWGDQITQGLRTSPRCSWGPEMGPVEGPQSPSLLRRLKPNQVAAPGRGQLGMDMGGAAGWATNGSWVRDPQTPPSRAPAQRRAISCPALGREAHSWPGPF